MMLAERADAQGSWTRKALNGLLAAGVVLMPFSTPAGEDSVVFNFGIPFLMLFTLASLPWHAMRSFRVPARLGPLVFIGFATTAWILLTSMISPWLIPSLARASVHVLGFFVFLYFASMAGRDPQRRFAEFRRWNGVLVISGVVLAAYYAAVFAGAVVQYGIIEALSERWVGGISALPWGASNAIAATLLFPLVSALVPGAGETRKSWQAIAMALIMVGILLSLSRNAIACAVLLFLLVALVAKRRLPLLITACVILAMAAMGDWFAAGTLEDLGRLRFGDAEELRGLNHRLEMWEEMASLLPSYLVEPIGFYGSLPTFRTSPHNAVLTTAIEQGLIGLLFALLLFGETVRRLSARAPSESSYGANVRRILLAGILIVVINLQFEDPHFSYPYIVYCWYFLGLCALAAGGIASSPHDMPQRQAPLTST